MYQTCTTALAVRHMANSGKPIHCLNDLRGPMGKKLNKIQQQLAELQKYREVFGPLSKVDEDSDTEREGGSKSQDGSNDEDEEA